MKPWKKNILVAFAFIILCIWAVEFFIYSVGAIIHSLLVIAFFMLVVRFIRWRIDRKSRKEARIHKNDLDGRLRG